MDKPAFRRRLREGAERLGWRLPASLEDDCGWLTDALLRWNAKVNLTAIVDPFEVLDKHIFDSLAVLGVLPGDAATLLDVGTGAGFPGLPIALARPELEVTLVEAAAKKVGFLKFVIAGLHLAPRVRAVHATLAAAPAREGLGPFDVAVSRALRDPARWASLARPYLAPGGRLVVMTGPPWPGPVPSGWAVERVAELRLPASGDPRTVAAWRRVE